MSDYIYEEIQNKMDNEGLGYFLYGYTDSSIMPDEKGKELFEKANKSLKDFENYVENKAEEERLEGIV